MQRVLTTIDRRQLLRIIRFARQFSPSWVLGSLVCSFLLASALSLYFSLALLPVGPNARVKGRAPSETLRAERKKLAKADIETILGRNIFNSEGKVGDAVDGGVKAGQKATGRIVRTGLPLRVVGLIFAGDPYNGLATIENTEKRRIGSYVVGDNVLDGAILVEIYDDRVILERNSEREFLEVPRFEVPSGRRKGQRPGGSGMPVLDRLASRPPADTFKEDGFERKGNAIKLTEEFKRNLLSPDQLAKVLQDAKAEPNIVGGELKGFRLTRIRENSVYEKAGFQNGDVIEEINGIPLRDAAGAIRLLNQLRNEKEIEVRVSRNGQTMNMGIQVQ